MRVVEVAERSPKKCAVTGREKGPFVDFQVMVDPGSPNVPNSLYVHTAILEQVSKDELGMVPKREVDTLVDQLGKVTDELAELRGFMELYAELEAYVLKNAPERSAA